MRRSKNHQLPARLGIGLAILALGALTVVFATPAMAGATFSLADDFSDSNPSGAWTYGYYEGVVNQTTFEKFVDYELHTGPPLDGAGVLQIHRDAGTDDPVVAKNIGPTDYCGGPCSGIDFHEGAVTLGPYLGPAVARFTAPSAGDWQVDATFATVQSGNSAPSAWVFNGTSFDLVSPSVPAFPNPVVYSELLTLEAGDVVDFVVWGNNSQNKTTEVSATITCACDDPIAWWQFDEDSDQDGASGSVVLDSTMNDNDGHLWNGASRVPSPFGITAALLDGVNDYVNVGSKSILDNLQAFTYSAWVHPTAFGDREIFSKRNSTKELRFTGAGTLRGCVIASGGNACSDSVETVPLGTWTHVAMTHDHAGDRKVHLYIDGVEVGYTSQSTASGMMASDAPNPQLLGRRQNKSRAFAGMLDEMMIFDTALSECQIGALAEPPLSCPCYTADDLLAVPIVECGENFPGFPDLAGVIFADGGGACSGSNCFASGLTCAYVANGQSVIEVGLTPEVDAGCRALILANCENPNLGGSGLSSSELFIGQ